MTTDEIERQVELMRAAGRLNMPVPLSEWREMMMARIPKGQITIGKDGKVKVRDRTPRALSIGKKAKADRLEKAYRANRDRKK